jgi:hydroxyacylglutathione hydrolase
MDINIQFVSIFNDNYIWLIINSIKRSVVAIDPGDAEPLLHYLQANQLDLAAILITHHHFDHTQGIDALKREFNIPVYGPKNGQIKGLTHTVEEGDRICIPSFGTEFNVLNIPGHTLDHVAYIAPGLLFCGDTLFSAGCGRLFEGTAQQMYHSLQKLAALPDETKIFCAHEYTLQNLKFAQLVEPNNQWVQARLKQVIVLRQDSQPTLPSSIEAEKRINPFLRCDVKEVIKSVEDWVGFQLEDPVQVFKYLREWKDGVSILPKSLGNSEPHA